MREIKLRAWLKDHDTKKLYAEHFGLHEISQGSIMSRDSGWESLSYCIIEQFTGIRDKNGGEIYEGDILKDEYDEIYRVIYIEENSAYFCLDIDNDTSKLASIYKPVIMGNVHENPRTEDI